MYLDTLDNFAAVAEKKAAVIRRHPLPFLVSAMMAGAYVGLGIILIFSVGATLDPSLRRLVMGASFGIALTLVGFLLYALIREMENRAEAQARSALPTPAQAQSGGAK